MINPGYQYLGSAEKLNRNHDWFNMPVLCTLTHAHCYLPTDIAPRCGLAVASNNRQGCNK